jgi:formate hydrogenlyase subunit 3/multisubunit Na+/H+ antiporter MnhD subunit
MNKQDIKKLTWKYFWQQKLKEIGIFVGIVGGIIFLPYWFGLLTKLIFPMFETDFFEGEFGRFSIWLHGLFFLALFLLILLVIWYWVEINWDKAKERAEKELKSGRGK